MCLFNDCFNECFWKEKGERCVISGLESMIGVSFLQPDKIFPPVSNNLPSPLSCVWFTLCLLQIYKPSVQQHSSSSVVKLSQMFGAVRHFLQQ